MRRISRSTARALQPWLILLTMVVGLLVLPRVFGGNVNSFTVYTIIQAFADFGLVALGLGLSIALRAVRLHNGEIRAKNAGPGLVVEIDLPFI